MLTTKKIYDSNFFKILVYKLVIYNLKHKFSEDV